MLRPKDIFYDLFKASRKEYIVSNGVRDYYEHNYLTMHQYNQHLAGTFILNVFPVTNNMCNFIILNLNCFLYNTILEIEKKHLPLYCFESKHGMHIYMFFKKSVNLSEAMDAIIEYSNLLGDLLKIDDCSIIPNCSESKIALPYFGMLRNKLCFIRNKKVETMDFNSAMIYIHNRLKDQKI